MEFCLAVAAIDGRVGLRHFDDAWARDPRVTGLIERIGFESRADLEPDVSADAVPAEVTVHARGRTFTRKVLVPSGDPRNPMNQAERLEKFLDCTGGIASDAVAQRLFDDFERLDRFDVLAPLISELRDVGEPQGATSGSAR